MRPSKNVETLRGIASDACVAGPLPATCIAAARFCTPDARECLRKPTKAHVDISRGWSCRLPDVDTDVHAHVDGC